MTKKEKKNENMPLDQDERRELRKDEQADLPVWIHSINQKEKLE